MKANIKFSLLVICIFSAIATSAQTFSLDTVLAIISERSPMLQEYDYRAKALDEYAKGSTSWMAPMVGAGTFMTPYRKGDGMNEQNQGAWMFSVEQQIPNPGALNANKKYMQSKASVERQGRAIRFNELRSAAKTYYYQWLVAERRMTVLNESERTMALMLKLARIRYPYNQGSLGNIYKAEAKISEVQNMQLMTQSEIERSRYQLKSLMNISPTDSMSIDTTTVVEFDDRQLITDTTSLRDQRSDIRQLNQNIEVMRLNQRLQRYAAKPALKLKFDHMQSIGDMPNQFSAMAMVSIPIAPWSSRMYKAEAKGMQRDLEAMKKGREAVLLETSGMLTGMAHQLTRMKQQLGNYSTKIIPALNKNYQTVMLAYEENREQLPTVIDAWEALNMARMEYLNKTNEYYLMIISYEKELEK